MGESITAAGAMNSHAHQGTEDEQDDEEERLIAGCLWFRMSCVRRPSSHRSATLRLNFTVGKWNSWPVIGNQPFNHLIRSHALNGKNLELVALTVDALALVKLSLHHCINSRIFAVEMGLWHFTSHLERSHVVRDADMSSVVGSAD